MNREEMNREPEVDMDKVMAEYTLIQLQQTLEEVQKSGKKLIEEINIQKYLNYLIFGLINSFVQSLAYQNKGSENLHDEWFSMCEDLKKQVSIGFMSGRISGQVKRIKTDIEKLALKNAKKRRKND